MQPKEPQNGGEKINVLVCLSSSPSNQKVIRSAARFARGNHSSLTALFVDDSRQRENDRHLQMNMALARSLGANVEIVCHKDILGAVSEYAREMSITDLFIGYSGPARGSLLRRQPAYRLVHALPDVDVHIIPDASTRLRPSELHAGSSARLNARDLLRMFLIMALATGLSVLFYHSRFSNSNIITIYILAVLMTSVVCAERIYGIMAAILYILLFNFLFIDPRFSFLVYDPDYLVTYLVSIIAAIVTGNISSRMKQVSLQASMNAYQTRILLNASEALQRAQSADEIAAITAARLQELLDRHIVFYPVTDRNLVLKTGDAADTQPAGLSLSDKEREAVEWTLAHNQRTGWETRHFPDLSYQYLSVRTGNAIYGIIGVEASPTPLNQFEENILLSLIGECALSLESEQSRKESKEAQIIAENERFRSELLRSVSHDLRTPLTSISGNAANLTEHADEFSKEEKERIYADIYQDSIWLIDLVENLLSITKLEEHVAIHPTCEVVADVLQSAVSQAGRHKGSHTIVLETDHDCLLARMDVALIMQVIRNLIGNALAHTPPQTTITVRDWQEGDKVMISVADDGPGIAQEDKPHIFDLFYTGRALGADSSRSLGLGLNLCRAILEAHGQQITLTDNIPHGAVFTCSLQLWKGQEDEPISDPDH